MTIGADSSDEELARASSEHPVFRWRPDSGKSPATGPAG